MAREARKISKSGMYAVSLCGEKLFKTDADKQMFLSLLEKYFEGGEVYGYDLSDTEIRLVVKETQKGISMTMKPLTTSYARYFNKTHNLNGKLFSGRFKSEPLESEEDKQQAIKVLSQKGTQKKAAKPRDTKIEKKQEVKEEPKKIIRRNEMPSYLL